MGCSKEDSAILSHGDEITRGIKPTNVPLMNILKSAIYWDEIKAFAYTEPDGKGEENVLYDTELVLETWRPHEMLVFNDEQVIKYIFNTDDI